MAYLLSEMKLKIRIKKIIKKELEKFCFGDVASRYLLSIGISPLYVTSLLIYTTHKYINQKTINNRVKQNLSLDCSVTALNDILFSKIFPPCFFLLN